MANRKKADGEPKTYRALNGINWPDGKGGENRAERGDLITSVALSDEFAKGFLEVTPGRPADIESLEETAPAAPAAAEEKE
jgi:hypothetical protein